jgi:shikimate kinase
MVSKADVIVLVGPMGVGKSTVGKKLANSMGLAFSDTDATFTKQYGNIAEFFAVSGEEQFRAIEEQLVAKAVSAPGVVATGGGSVLSAKTRDLLTGATVVYLATDGTHMAKRLSQGNRPLLKNGLTDWNRIYSERKPIYEAIADITIDSSGHPIKQTVTEIREALGLQ